MKIKNYKFGEAVRLLASEAGMPVFKFTKLDEEKEKRWNVYKSILDKYANYCHQELLSGKYPEVLSYLKNRKITKKEITFFKIGYATGKKDFYEDLKKNYDEKEIINSGIYYFDEKNKIYVDRFRNRILFPVKNLGGSVFAIGGRAVSKNAFAKYINSPETEFYKKGNNLYNLNSAKDCRNKNDEVYIVEGYMDVVNLHKFGISNVIANLGTAMTERQAELVWKFFKNPIICLDGDSSGQKAALRAAERLFPLVKADNNIFFLTLPEDMDPDSYINENGKESFLQLAESKIEIQNFIWNSYYKEVNKNNPHSLTLFEKKIKMLCNNVQDKTLAKYFLDDFIKRINELTPNIGGKKNNLFRFRKPLNPLQKTKEAYKKQNKFEKEEFKEFSILFLIINNLHIFKKNIELISEVIFLNDSLNEFKRQIIDFLLQDNLPDKRSLEEGDVDKQFNNIINLVNANAPVKIIYKNKSETEIVAMFNEIRSEIKKIKLQKRINTLEDKVSVNLDENLYSELLSLRNQLKGR